MSSERQIFFQIGNKQIGFRGNEDISETLCQVLPVSTANPGIEPIWITEPVTDVTTAFDAICDKVMNQFDGHLWIEACSAVSPQGKQVILAGKSFAGKSTLSIALTRFGWKIGSEDITFIVDNRIPSQPKPICLRDGAQDLIRETTGRGLEVVSDYWFFEADSYTDSDIVDPLDAIILIEGLAPIGSELEVKRVDADSVARELISYSNAIFSPDDYVPLLYSWARNAKSCWSLSGGTLRERINQIQDIVSR